MFLYRYWLLLASGTVKVWVGVHVDVLTTGGGVLFRFWSEVWVKFLVLEDCLVSGGDVRVTCFAWNDFAFYFMQVLFQVIWI